MPKERLYEPNFNSQLGLKQSHSLTNMPFGALLDVKNMNLDGFGGKSSRRGYEYLFHLYKTDDDGAQHEVRERILSLLDYRKINGLQEVLAFAGDSIFSWDENEVNVVREGLAEGIRWQWLIYNDRVYGVNGEDSSFVYDGRGYTQISIDEPSAVDVEIDTNPNDESQLDGVYSYTLTFYDSERGFESNPLIVEQNLEFLEADVGDGGLEVVISGLPQATDGQRVDKYRIYRKWKRNSEGINQETQFTQIAEIDYNPDGNFTDTGFLSSTISLDYDTGQLDEGRTPHPQSRLIAEAFDRLFMVPENDPTLLVYSKRSEVHAFPSANFFPIGRTGGERIIKLERHQNALLIHRRDGIYILDNDPSVATPRRISGRGTQDYLTSVADVDNSLYRLTPKGYYRMSPTEFSVGDLREEYIGTDIVTEERFIDWKSTDNVVMYNYQRQNSRHVYAFFPNSATYSTKVHVFDYRLSQWVKYELGTDVYSITDYLQRGDQRTILGDGFGRVYVWDVGKTDGIRLLPDELNGQVTEEPAEDDLNSLRDENQSWDENELVGLVVEVTAGQGKNQRRRIIANNEDTLFVEHAWALPIDESSVYNIAAIDAYADEFWNSNQFQDRWKRMRWLTPHVRQTGSFDIELCFRRDFNGAFETCEKLNLGVRNESIWGFMIWGQGVWAEAASTLNRVRFNGKYKYYTIRYRNRRAGESFLWEGHGTKYQVLHDRNR